VGLIMCNIDLITQLSQKLSRGGSFTLPQPKSPNQNRVKRGFMISSKTETLNKELEHIKATFCDKNDYPKRLVD